MNNINIDTEKLSQEIEKIRKINENFEDIFSKIKDNTNQLKDCWKTRTSESVFSSFEEFYSSLENVVSTFQKDIEFLEKVVNDNYIEEEKGINQLIDNKIAM